ncbi:MAG TPA: hypothetical protein VF774_12980 [Pseudoduganella sp.]
MTMYQKIPTASTRIDPLMLVAAAGIVLLSVAATAAIVRWLPDTSRDGEAPVTPAVPAASASSETLPAMPAVRKVHEQNSQARTTRFASA